MNERYQVVIYDKEEIRDYKNYKEYEKIEMFREIQKVISDYTPSKIEILIIIED